MKTFSASSIGSGFFRNFIHPNSKKYISRGVLSTCIKWRNYLSWSAGSVSQNNNFFVVVYDFKKTTILALTLVCAMSRWHSDKTSKNEKGHTQESAHTGIGSSNYHAPWTTSTVTTLFSTLLRGWNTELQPPSRGIPWLVTFAALAPLPGHKDINDFLRYKVLKQLIYYFT